MAALKYVFYLSLIVFILLLSYALTTEKPRQYKAMLVVDIPKTPSLSALWGYGIEKGRQLEGALAPAEDDISKLSEIKPGDDPAKVTTNNTEALMSSRANQRLQPLSFTPNTVVAFSNNDAGGKIVLNTTKCEKFPGFVAYTTASDGKVDYGCWTFDELYIVINWNHGGLNNYTYDRFLDYQSGGLLKAKHLFEATKVGSLNATSEGAKHGR